MKCTYKFKLPWKAQGVKFPSTITVKHFDCLTFILLQELKRGKTQNVDTVIQRHGVSRFNETSEQCKPTGVCCRWRLFSRHHTCVCWVHHINVHRHLVLKINANQKLIVCSPFWQTIFCWEYKPNAYITKDVIVYCDLRDRNCWLAVDRACIKL